MIYRANLPLYVHTDTDTSVPVAEHDQLPDTTLPGEIERLLAAGAIREVPTSSVTVGDLDALTVADLQAYAAEHSIDLGDAKLKADILAAIQAALLAG